MKKRVVDTNINKEVSNLQISYSKKLKKELYFKILILIILILLVGITSFRTGRKFYLLSNTYFGNTNGAVNTEVCKWNFKAKIIIRNEVIYGE